MRKFIIAALSAVAFVGITAPVASASFSSELRAGNRVEQKLQSRYPRYSVVAVCDQQGSRYWCTVSGSHGNCFVSGHAWVRSNRVTLVGVNRSCF